MSRPAIFEIVVRGELGESFRTMFDEVRLETRPGRTVILVEVIDSAHLHGVLERIRDLALEIESVNSVESAPPPDVRKGEHVD